MYVTKTLSSLRSSPHLMSLPPPEGPYSGIAVIQDENVMDQDADCWGFSKRAGLNILPIPQNKIIGISHQSVTLIPGISDQSVMMIPVVDEPLSSNTYYVIQAGHAITCSSSEDDEVQDVCWPLIENKSAKRQPFDPDNIYQQFKIIDSGATSSRMHAESLAYDAHPPYFMRKYNWSSTTTASPTSWPCRLNEAEGQGICARLRDRLPEFEFPFGVRSSDHLLVGRWYVPFIFIKEFGMHYKDQMRSSMYYKMSLEQRWENIFEAENVGKDSVAAEVDVRVKSEAVMLGGRVGVQVEGRLVDGVVRYESEEQRVGGIGLRFGVVERMKWEQARAGWVDVGGAEVRVVKQFNGGRWRRFGCYMLVERFVLRRMDGSLALTHDFYHKHQLRTKWEIDSLRRKKAR